ncbi:SH3 domain-containing protein [Rhizobium sp. AG855]|uniref:SH3 domain-containing protein n=1 Tax=Rhizobium sp. AG855 TaxID=2183898 RepID=UPI000E759D4B|nr:SH3 domain-containing protein [Rhizobium sp. AG855]RKE78272.1 SH3-like domain-containing protein [Rhizobium sp. AG855]
MSVNLSRVSLLSGALALFLIAGTPPGLAQSTTKGSSGLPLPRFVSLKAEKVNLRIGPSTDYAVSWRYLKSGLPVEIIREYENWRQIRDADGTEGWVSQTLLSGQRTAVAAPWMRGKGSNVYVMMRRDSMSSAAVIAKLEPGVVVKVEECNGNWCKAETQGVTGWVSQEEIWGAYPGEAFK